MRIQATNLSLRAIPFTFIVLWSAISWGQAQDRILPLNGGPLEGTIESTTPTHLKVTTRTGDREVAVETIKLIRFAGEPAQLGRARTAAQENQFDVVLQEVSNIDVKQIERSIIQEEVTFLRAMAKAKIGEDTEAAARELATFLKSSPQNYHYFEAVELLGDSLMKMGRFTTAADTFARLGKAPWPEMKLRALVREAAALQAQGPEKCKDALGKYEQVINAQANKPGVDRLRQMARVGRAACQAETGEAEAAIKELLDVIRTGDHEDVELFARANNALGACYRKTNQMKYAEMRYLQTDLNFYADSEAHAEALYYLSVICPELGHADRGTAARKRLKARYPSSPWALKP